MTSVDRDAYMTPTPAQVAGLVATHGMEAAAGRWHWLDDRTLGSLAQAGRAAKGEVIQRANKRRSYSELDAAVCVESSFVLGSMARGERASGVGHNVTQGLFPRRGVDFVRITPEERGRAASIGNLANNGAVEAIAERDRRHAHELAVGQVLRAALSLVTEQPLTGRYRLPPVDDVLRAALAGLPTTAIEAVFPDLTPVAALAEVPAEDAVPVPVPDPTPPAEVPAVSEITPETTPHIHRRAPDDAVIRRDHADGGGLVPLAARYGIHPTSLYAHWRRMRLSGSGRMDGLGAAQRRAEEQAVEPAPQVSVPADVPVEPVAPEPVAPPREVDPYGALSFEDAVAEVAVIEGAAPLGTRDLARAVDLAAEKGLDRASAIAWIRADIRAVAEARVIMTKDQITSVADDVFRELMLADERGTRQ